ncbi:MAG: DUF3097 family protein [Antricoccus sp.]
MKSHNYSSDVTKKRPISAPLSVPAELDVVLEEVTSEFCGAIIEVTKDTVTLEDRYGRTRVFPLKHNGFLLEGASVMLRRPSTTTLENTPRSRTASGSFTATDQRAKVAQAGRILVEGVHDAALVERIWGADLRAEGIVVEPLHGIDDLELLVRQLQPHGQARLGVLVDHLIPGSKESRIVGKIQNPHVLITGHPYVDIWQAVRPASIGISAWPQIPKGQSWKAGVCAALGMPDEQSMWRRVLQSVSNYADVETALITAVERLIDFIYESTAPRDS